MKVIVVVAFNELLTAPMLIVGFDGWLEGPGADLRYVPDLYTSFLHIFVAMLLHDVSFYHFHRALHHRKLYKHIQDSPRVPIPNGSCINICTSRGTLLDRSPWSFIGSNANGITLASALGLVHVAGCSNYERSFW